jgi:glycerophosphoryl diester phosphodiesterase
MTTIQTRFAFTLLACVATSTSLLHADQTMWTFSNSADRLAADSGTATLDYYDPFVSGWGPTATVYDTASALGLPLINGSDADVMAFPACAPGEGYAITHGFSPNGSYQTSGLVSNYTVIMDVLFPAASDGQWRSLLQTDTANATDGDFFVKNQASGGIGITGNYQGAILPDTWHRIVWVMRAAPGEGQAHRYIDGQFVGAIGTTGSGLEERFALLSELLLFADESNDTQAGYVSSISILDRKLTFDDVVALGGPNAAGADVPGAAAPAYADLMSRPVGTLGHRGSSGCAPENTLAAINQAFVEGAAGTEIDTRITSDGVVIAFHDSTVDRTTDGTGNVADMTLAQIKALDAGSWFSPDFVGEQVPSLEEVLTASSGKGIIYLDIKTGGQAAGFATAVANSGFPLSDLWFWSPGNTAYAAEIRAALPGAQIVWGGPAATWATDPNYFTDLKALGVIGFSYGQGGADLAFSARAKEEGMFVEVFTVLNLDQYRAAADAGVDYMETDFTNVMQAMQPLQTAAASGPQPSDSTADLPDSLVLVWIPGLDATAHRVHFGTTNPPPFVREQSFDLYQTPSLDPDSTYYWQIDTVTAGGTVTGPVWSFSTLPPPSPDGIHEWHLNSDLSSVAGDAVLGYADDTQTLVAFETTDGTTVPHMANGPAKYVRVPAFTDAADGINLSFVTTGPNGGGNELNQYAFVFDLLVPGPLNWMSIFNAAPNNANDGDFFVQPNGALGTAAIAYSPAGTIVSGQWHRIIFNADLAAGNVSYYVDGTRVVQRTGAALTDGRFSLFESTDNAGPHVRLFNDENAETVEMLVGSVAFVDQTLTDEIATGLGAADANGIFFPATLFDLKIVNIAYDNTLEETVLTWSGDPGKVYTIETSTDLTTWTPLSPTQAGPGESGEYRHSVDANTVSVLYYRIFEGD